MRIHPTIVVCLVALTAMAVEGSSATSSPPTDSLGNGLRMPDGTAYFLGESELRKALEEESESHLDESGIYTNRQAARDLIADLIERSQQSSRADDDGCVRPYFFGKNEHEYQRDPYSFENEAKANHQTPIDLSHLAAEIAIVRVVATEPGIISAKLGTLVQFEVEEWIKQDPERDALGEPTHLFSNDVWIELGSRVYCMRRTAVNRIAPDDRLVVFGYRHPFGKFFHTGNLFPLDGDVILPQPYPLMDRTFPVSLQELLAAVETSGS